MKCDICGGENECKPTMFKMADEPLEKEDWIELHYHIVHVHLPFLHSIVSRARKRQRDMKKQEKTQR